MEKILWLNFPYPLFFFAFELGVPGDNYGKKSIKSPFSIKTHLAKSHFSIMSARAHEYVISASINV
jgi:hypothetical protein